MKILIITDAWTPQINGVVRTLQATEQELTIQGHEVHVFCPDPNGSLTFALPFYPEIKLEFFVRKRIAKVIADWHPDAIHIATEGPLGWSARSVCLQQKRPFTTSYHTAFPEYLASRSPKIIAPLVRNLTYRLLRYFHRPTSAIMVATASIEKLLTYHKFPIEKMVRWSRGVNADLFQPYAEPVNAYRDMPRPLLLSVGRVAVEKNLEAFLTLQTSGSKVVIGDGPDLIALQKKYPEVHFLGSLTGEKLARHYAGADLFVFPSTTDTFGLVLLEACATGLRVAALPAPGPVDLFSAELSKDFAVINEDLQIAVDQALKLPQPNLSSRKFAAGYSWAACTQQFLSHV